VVVVTVLIIVVVIITISVVIVVVVDSTFKMFSTRFMHLNHVHILHLILMLIW